MSPPPPPNDKFSPAPTRDRTRSKYNRHKQSISQPVRQAVRTRPRTSQPATQEREKPARRARSQSRSRTQQQAEAQKPARKVSFAAVGLVFASLRPKMRLPPIFNIVRNAVLLVVLIMTIVCLAIAVHFQGILLTSDLTRFIPFGIFVCSLSLLVDLVLLGFGLRNGWNPISVRIELGCLGLIGTLWLALGAFLGVSPSQDATVECFSSASDNDPIDFPGFNTDTYHAQYRVMEAFSVFNTVLIWAYFIFLLGLSLREHFWLGRHEIWLRSVTAYSWFGDGKRSSPSRSDSNRSTARMLPPPVTARGQSRGRSRSQSRSRALERGDSTRDIYDTRERDMNTRRPAPIVSVNRHRSQSRDIERSLPVASKFAGVSRTFGYALQDPAPPPKRGESAQRQRSTSRDAQTRPEAARRNSSQQRQRSTSREVPERRGSGSRERSRDPTAGPSRQLSTRMAEVDKRVGGRPATSLERRATDFPRSTSQRPTVHRENTTRSDGPDTRRGRSTSRQPSGARSRETTTPTTTAATSRRPSRSGAAAGGASRPSKPSDDRGPRTAPGPYKPPAAHTRESRGRPAAKTPGR